MARKKQKRKPAAKKTDKTEVQIMSEPRHNMVAYLDPQDKLVEFNEITKFLRESRINEAITHQTPVYKTLIKAFWDSANIIKVDGQEVIRGKVNELAVDVSVEILNTVLQLHDDPDAPYSVPLMCQRGCLLRMKCVDDILGGQINKAWLPLRYKFLLHILIQCLSNRRSGYDMANNDLVGLMVSLVLNKPFSISKYIFANMKENLGRTGVGGSKFWMYPRFLQMIMNVQHPNLPKSDNDVLKIDVMLEHSLKIFRGKTAKRYKESTPPRKMFGALANTAYVAPENDKWRHDDSQSDNEEPTLKKMIKDKFGRKKRKIKIFGDSDYESDNGDGDDKGGDGGDVGASGASTPGGDKSKQPVDDDESDSDDIPAEPGYEHYFDDHGVRQVRRLCTDQDVDYVSSDTESECLRKKKADVCRKKKSKKTIAASSAEPTITQPETISEPVLEANFNPQFAFIAEETEALMTSPTATTEPPPVTKTATEPPPIVTTQAEPLHATSSIQQYRSTTYQQSPERRSRMFSEMDQDEKVDFLFTQLQAAASQMNQQSEFMSSTRNTVIKQQLEINALKETVGKQQAEITQLRAENERLKVADAERAAQLQQMRVADNARGIEMNMLKERSAAVQQSAETFAAKHDDMRQWYNERNTTLINGFSTIKDAFEMSRKRVNTLWSERCKAQEVLQKRDHDSEDPGNPNASASSEQP
ncbi:hypothetical protein Hdeb2414_s0178g00824901 [Helianthus debilis subsp. tardiflorus]